MAADTKLTALIEARDRLSEKLDRINKKIKKLSSDVQKESKKIEKSTKNASESVAKYWTLMVAKVSAALYGLQTAIDSAIDYAKFEQNIRALQTRVTAMGLNFKKVFSDIKKAAAGMIDNETISKMSNYAISLGIPIQKVPQLMQIARVKAREMGEDIVQAFEDIVTGIGRASPMILDNLGIIVDSKAAYEEYAKSVGKSANELSSQEQKLAILDYVIKQNIKDLSLYNLKQKTLIERVSTVNAQLKNLKMSLGKSFTPLLEELLKLWKKFEPIINHVIEGWSMIVETALDAIDAIVGAFEWLGGEIKKSMEKAATNFIDLFKWVKNGFKGGFHGLVTMIERDFAKIDDAFKENLHKYPGYFAELFDKWKAKISEIHTYYKNGMLPIEVKVKQPKITKPKNETVTTKNETTEELNIVDNSLVWFRNFQKIMEQARKAFDDFVRLVNQGTASALDEQLLKWDDWKKKVIAKAKEAGVYNAEMEAQITEIAEKRKEEIREKYREQRIREDIRAAEESATNWSELLDSMLKAGQMTYIQYLRQKLAVLTHLLDTFKAKLGSIHGSKAFEDLAIKMKILRIAIAKTSKELSGSFSQGIRDGIGSVISSFGTLYQNVVSMTQEAARAMSEAMGGFFFDAMTGKLKSFGDYVRSFLGSIARAISDFIARMLVQKALTAIFAHTGGFVAGTGYLKRYHGGGEVTKDDTDWKTAPRYHDGGLAYDEVPAVLQVGEGVLSREGVKALGALNRGLIPQMQGGAGAVNITINAVDAKSFADMVNRNPNVIVAPIMRALRMNGSLRYEIRGVR